MNQRQMCHSLEWVLSWLMNRAAKWDFFRQVPKRVACFDQCNVSQDDHIWMYFFRCALCNVCLTGFVVPLQCRDSYTVGDCSAWLFYFMSQDRWQFFCQFLMLVWISRTTLDATHGSPGSQLSRTCPTTLQDWLQIQCLLDEGCALDDVACMETWMTFGCQNWQNWSRGRRMTSVAIPSWTRCVPAICEDHQRTGHQCTT